MAWRCPASLLRWLTTAWPVAKTLAMGPTQRIIASYQMPMDMMLLPDISRS